MNLVFRRKKLFFTILYCNAANNFGFPEFSSFLSPFEDLYANIYSEYPYTVLFAGDFNTHCQQWWPGGDTNAEETALDNLVCVWGGGGASYGPLLYRVKGIFRAISENETGVGWSVGRVHGVTFNSCSCCVRVNSKTTEASRSEQGKK